jgi:hypothetical protein
MDHGGGKALNDPWIGARVTLPGQKTGYPAHGYSPFSVSRAS